MRAEGNRQLRIVVSGGIGSGKSTVLSILARLGFAVIEADRVGHQVIEPDGPAYSAVVEEWPAVVVDGRIDRARLAAIVFTHHDQLARLEELTHPHIREAVAAQVAAAAGADVAVELPLATDLLGPGWIRLLVTAPESIRIARKTAAGMAEQDVINRMNSQPAPAEWWAAADVIVENSGSPEELEHEVAAAISALRS